MSTTQPINSTTVQRVFPKNRLGSAMKQSQSFVVSSGQKSRSRGGGVVDFWPSPMADFQSRRLMTENMENEFIETRA